MALIKKTIFLIVFVLVALSRTVSASGLGACVRCPDPAAPTAGDLYTMRIANGMGIAQSYGEKKDRPGMYYYNALRECDPQDFVAIYDSENNAQLSFVIKDKKRRGQTTGPNRNRCNLKNIIGYATDGDFEPVCPFGGAEELAAQWAKARADAVPPPPKKTGFWRGITGSKRH